MRDGRSLMPISYKSGVYLPSQIRPLTYYDSSRDDRRGLRSANKSLTCQSEPDLAQNSSNKGSPRQDFTISAGPRHPHSNKATSNHPRALSFHSHLQSIQELSAPALTSKRSEGSAPTHVLEPLRNSGPYSSSSKYSGNSAQKLEKISCSRSSSSTGR